MNKCSKCDLQTSPQDQLACSQCNKVFHYLCVDKTEENFRKMGTRRNAWKCIDCKPNTLKIQTSNEGEKNVSNVNMDEFMTEIRGLVADMNAKMCNTDKKMDEMMGKFDEMKRSYEMILAKQKELEQENAVLKKSTNEMKEIYEDKIDMLENRSRISNIEIKNMPETQGEDTVKIVEMIGKAIGIDNIREGDIQVALRVDSFNKEKEKGKRAIIVHMGSRYLRNKWLTAYKTFNSKKPGEHRKSLTTQLINKNLPDLPIYLNEHITVKRKILLNETKAFARAKSFKYVWVKDAYILIKKNDNEKKVFKLSSNTELEELKKKVANFST